MFTSNQILFLFILFLLHLLTALIISQSTWNSTSMKGAIQVQIEQIRQALIKHMIFYLTSDWKNGVGVILKQANRRIKPSAFVPPFPEGAECL